MLMFGDIFRYKESAYIYLVAKDDGITYYAAKIISDRETVSELLKRREGSSIIRNFNQTKLNIFKFITCFIILTTEGFQNQIAHLANSDKHNINMIEVERLGTLSKIDINSLKKEILDNIEVLPPLVIRYVKELET